MYRLEWTNLCVSPSFFRPATRRPTQKSVRGRQSCEPVLRDLYESVCSPLFLQWLNLGLTNSWCRQTATALLGTCWRDNVPLTILPLRPPPPYVCGWRGGWSPSCGGRNHVHVGRLAAAYGLSLTLNQVDDYSPTKWRTRSWSRAIAAPYSSLQEKRNDRDYYLLYFHHPF